MGRNRITDDAADRDRMRCRQTRRGKAMIDGRAAMVRMPSAGRSLLFEIERSHEGQQGDHAGTLDREGQFALMLGAGS